MHLLSPEHALLNSNNAFEYPVTLLWITQLYSYVQHVVTLWYRVLLCAHVGVHSVRLLPSVQPLAVLPDGCQVPGAAHPS